MENSEPQKRKNIGLFLVGIIITLAAFLRFFRISEYMTFLGDEGRDVIVAKHILEGKLTLLGPRASAGDFFLGPIYYYFIAPFLWLTKLDPVGPAIMIAIFGVATVFLIYLVGKKLFDEKTGLFAASLYSVSPIVIAYSRSSWNPNPVPFFSILSLFLLYLGVKNNKLKLFFIVGILLGITMQLHYLAVFLAIIIVVFIFLGTLYIKRKVEILDLGKKYISIFMGFVIGFSPFLAFELKHGFPNTRTIFGFIFSNTFSPEKNTSILTIASDVFFRLFARLITRFPPPEQVSIEAHLDLKIWQVITVFLAIASIWAILRIKNRLTVILMLTWLILGVLLFGLYKRNIYDYYFGFMFPLPFLFVGNFLSELFGSKHLKRLGMLVSISIFIFLFIFNLLGAPFLSLPNNQRGQVKKISEFILEKAENKPFNFALITGGNSDHAYRYFFEVEGNKPIDIQNLVIDPKRESVTNQLFVVCESIPCQPLGHPLWEIAGFGRAEVVNSWDISVVKVYKLIQYSDK